MQRIGRVQRLDQVGRFADDMQRLAAGGEDCRARTGLQ